MTINLPQNFRTSFYAASVLAIALGLWLAQLWPAENQVRLHSEHLLRQLEKKNWSAVGDFIAPEYRDDWRDDRALVLSRLQVTLRFFSSLTITATSQKVRLDPPGGTWSARIQLAGRGGEFAPEILSRVNSLTTPFELHWRQQSWKPWDWQLVAVSNPQLELPGGAY